MSAPESESEPLARDKRAGFSAAVALYPGCTAQLQRRRAAPGAYRPTAPLLILIGEKDDWTPAEPCRKLADAAQAAGYPVRIKIYPDAHHGFDSDRPVRFVEARVNSNSPTGRGATTGGNRRGVGRQHSRGRRVLPRAALAESEPPSLVAQDHAVFLDLLHPEASIGRVALDVLCGR